MLVLPSDPEKQLLGLVAEGDEAAFSQLFHAYHQRLGAYIYRLTESFSSTQEIVQDVFVKIWLKRATLTSIEHFDAYLFTAARNHVYNHLRSIARQRAQQAALEASLPPDSAAQAWEENEEEVALMDLLDEAIDHLPSQQKNVYILHRREHLSHAQIAERMHLSVETVKKHMSLALNTIRDHLSAKAGFFTR